MYNITEITIEEAIDDLELLKCQEGITNFVITEKYSIVKEFIVSNLSIGIEDDIVFCWDDDGVINQQSSILIGFLKEHIVSICRVCDKDNCIKYEYCKFIDGIVTVKAVA